MCEGKSLILLLMTKKYRNLKEDLAIYIDIRGVFLFGHPMKEIDPRQCICINTNWQLPKAINFLLENFVIKPTKIE